MSKPKRKVKARRRYVRIDIDLAEFLYAKAIKAGFEGVGAVDELGDKIVKAQRLKPPKGYRDRLAYLRGLVSRFNRPEKE